MKVKEVVNRYLAWSLFVDLVLKRQHGQTNKALHVQYIQTRRAHSDTR